MASAWHEHRGSDRYDRKECDDGSILGRGRRMMDETISGNQPVGPSPEERRQHLSDTHCRTWIRDGILAKDLDEAISIVEAFGGRNEMPISHETAERMGRSEQDLGVVLAGLAEGMLLSRSDRFLDQIIAEIREEVARKGSFWRGWDYDGRGAFHKATVRVLPEGSGWVVRISVPRQDVETSLARELGLPMRFLRARHHVTFRTEGRLFSIPMEQIRHASRLVGSENPPTAESLLDALKTPTGDSDYGEAVLHEDESILVTMKFDETRVPQGFEMRRIARETDLAEVPAEWTAHLTGDEGFERIEGLARTWSSWPDPWAAGIEILISPRDSHDPEHERACIEASKSLARLWAGLPGAYRESDA